MEENGIRFSQWIREYSDLLFSYAMNRGFDRETSRDLVQDTFLAAWKNHEGFRGEASVKNWLFTILKNKIIDHFRKHSRSMMVEVKEEGFFFDEKDHWKTTQYPVEWTVEFSDNTARKEFMQVFRSCGSKLKELQHAVVTMKYMEDMDSQEICKNLNISSENFWVLMYRAKLKLRACLQKNWLDK
ncbi:MAG: sigma-70 family RNA polymerase sigma factor [Flavitalea sp.]